MHSGCTHVGAGWHLLTYAQKPNNGDPEPQNPATNPKVVALKSGNSLLPASGGGSSTLSLLMQYSQLYKTGISIAAVDNQLNYDNLYQERYMGLLPDDRHFFVDNSPLAHAKNLRGHLLLIHGTGDDNVHYNNCEQMINELVKYNKTFQLMSYPNRTHSLSEGEGTSRHLASTFTKFLQQNCPPGGR